MSSPETTRVAANENVDCKVSEPITSLADLAAAIGLTTEEMDEARNSLRGLIRPTTQNGPAEAEPFHRGAADPPSDEDRDADIVPERGSVNDWSKLDIRDGVIHYRIYQQDGSMQPMTAPDTIHNRQVISWIQIHDRM